MWNIRVTPFPAQVTPLTSLSQAHSEEGGAVLRILHALCAGTAACEALASYCPGPGAAGATGAVGVLNDCRRWGQAATLLILETLRR